MKKHLNFRILQQLPTLHSPILAPYLLIITLQVQAFAFLCFAILRWIHGDYDEAMWRWAIGLMMAGVQSLLRINLRSLSIENDNIKGKHSFSKK